MSHHEAKSLEPLGRRVWISSLFMAAVLLFLTAASARAISEPPKVAVVGMRDSEAFRQALAGFRQEFSRAARNARYLEISVPGEEIRKELALLKPDLVFSLGAAAAKAAAEGTDSPVIYAMVVDPHGSGLTGGRAAGVSLDIPYETQLRVYTQLIPRLRAVAVIYNPDENERNLPSILAAADLLNIRLKTFPVSSVQEIPRLRGLGADALWLIPDVMVCQPVIIQKMLLESLQDKIPVFGISSYYAQAGALAALAGDYRDAGKQAGELAAHIYKKERLKTPHIAPRKALLYLNAAAAERLGVRIPDELLRSAEAVYGQ